MRDSGRGCVPDAGPGGGWLRVAMACCNCSGHEFGPGNRIVRGLSSECGNCCGSGSGRIDVDGDDFLTGEVDGGVLARLEEANFADLLGGDAGGWKGSDAAGGEI